MTKRECRFQTQDHVVWMCYWPAKRIKHKDKNSYTKAACFEGMLDNGKTEMLNDEWVQGDPKQKTRALRGGMVEQSVVEFLKHNPGKRFRLPAGDSINLAPPAEPLPGRWVPSARPAVTCQQDKLRTCVFSSFASCCHCKKMSHLAKLVETQAHSKSMSVLNLDALEQVVRKIVPKDFLKVKRYARGTFDVNNEINSYQDRKLQLRDLEEMDHPTVVVLEGTEAGCYHAATVSGSWIFDSNLPSALPRTMDLLNWCCMGKYKCVAEARKFFFNYH